MVGNTVFFWVLPVMYVVFAGVFTAVTRYEPTLRSARWGATAFAIGVVAILFDTQRSLFPWWFFSIAVLLHWAALICILNAFLSRHDRYVPKIPAWVLFAFGSAINFWFTFADPQVTVRVPNANFVALGILLLGLPGIFASRRRLLDNLTAGIIAALVGIYAVRAAIYFALDQSAEYAHDPEWSQYMLIFYFSSAVSALAVAIQLILTITVDLVERQNRATSIDPLTGVANRRGLEQAIKAHDNNSKPIGSVIMIDLDHFKRVNDRHGHEVGDVVLAQTAQTILRHSENLGETVRLGGEEFAVLIYKTHSEAAEHLAYLLRTAIAGTSIAGADEPITVTASLGLAQVAHDETIRTAMRRADTALYAAKRAGVNGSKSRHPTCRRRHYPSRRDRQVRARPSAHQPGRAVPMGRNRHLLSGQNDRKRRFCGRSVCSGQDGCGWRAGSGRPAPRCS
jgi:diguanylate cyclase (GGDEF)-like protein